MIKIFYEHTLFKNVVKTKIYRIIKNSYSSNSEEKDNKLYPDHAH